MKFYKLDTDFKFGKFAGKSVYQIVILEPSYLDWCAINLDYFYISERVIQEIKTIKPDFELIIEGQQKLAEKFSNWATKEEAASKYDENDSYQNQTNWGHYNSDLDMDQQSEEFWNNI